MFKKITNIILIFFIAACLIIRGNFVFAATNLEQIRQKQEELDKVQKNINSLDQSIKKKDSEVKTLEKEIDILGDNISKANLEIERTKIALEKIGLDVEEVEENVTNKEAVIEHEKNFLKEFLRLVYKNDNSTFLERILSDEKLADVLADAEAMQNIQQKIQSALENLKQERADLKKNQLDLENKQDEQDQLFAMQEAQKAALQSDALKKDRFVIAAKTKKVEMETDLNSAEKTKKILRDEIFSLKSAGVSMSMQQALDIASFAASKTGIRPEFLLGLLKVESDLGNNVGGGNYKKDMSPAQHEAFFAVCQKLNLNPETMPVSKRPTNYKGWGGAMGPAQMMPKTWLGYEADVAQLTGNNPPSPWDNKDAFTAAALKLSRDGASSQNRDDEWKAAMMYLAGSNWNNPSLRWYGDRVLKLAEVYGS